MEKMVVMRMELRGAGANGVTASGLHAGAGMEDERWRDVKHGALLNAAIAVLMRGWC